MKAGNELVERQIYNNTWMLLKKYGIRGWNMDDLARESGVAKNTLYKIVGNKEALLSKIVFEVQNEYISIIEKAATSERPIHALYELIEVIPSIFKNYDTNVVSEINIKYPGLSMQYEINENRMTTALVSLYKKGLKAGHIRSDIDLEFFVMLQKIVRNQIIDKSGSSDDLAKNLKNALIIIIEGVAIRKQSPCMD